MPDTNSAIQNPDSTRQTVGALALLRPSGIQGKAVRIWHETPVLTFAS
ncbi:MAG: hypothetical protein AAF716_10200 [Cyanobacteria bacterium P01_D01_bin.1]